MGSEPALSFNETLRKAQSGDSDALRALLEAVEPHLQHLARKYADPTRADQSASDILQEAELRAWRQLAQFKGTDADPESLLMFRAWAGRIVRHVGLDNRRQARAQRRRDRDRATVSLSAGSGEGSRTVDRALQAPSSESTPSAKVSRAEELKRVLAFLDSLPDASEREVVKLYFFDELSLAEIAARCSVSPSLVKRRFRSGMERLEHGLKQHRSVP